MKSKTKIAIILLLFHLVLVLFEIGLIITIVLLLC